MMIASLLAQTDLTPALVLIIVLIVVVILLSQVLAQTRASIWRRFAKRHHLAFREENRRPRVEGQIADRPLRLEVDQESSDTGELGVQVVTLRIALHGVLPRDLGVSPAIPLIGEAQRALEDNTIATGDEPFDSQFIAHGATRDEVAQYLSPKRRAALLKLAEEAGANEVGMVDSFVYVRDRDVISNLAILEQRLNALLEVAPELDG